MMDLHAMLIANLTLINLPRLRIDTQQFGEVRISKNSKQTAMFLIFVMLYVKENGTVYDSKVSILMFFSINDMIMYNSNSKILH